MFYHSSFFFFSFPFFMKSSFKFFPVFQFWQKFPSPQGGGVMARIYIPVVLVSRMKSNRIIIKDLPKRMLIKEAICRSRKPRMIKILNSRVSKSKPELTKGWSRSLHYLISPNWSRPKYPRGSNSKPLNFNQKLGWNGFMGLFLNYLSVGTYNILQEPL